MRIAYADPPYYGCGHLYTDTPEAALRTYDNLDSWRDLFATLSEFDGWAMSMTSDNLHDLLPLAPREARIAAWVKPFAAFKRNVRIAYTWEPVLFVPARVSSKTGASVGRDHLAESITMRKGFTGAKPEKFCSWVLDLTGWVSGDEVADLFPGTGVMGRVVGLREMVPTDGQMQLMEDMTA